MTTDDVPLLVHWPEAVHRLEQVTFLVLPTGEVGVEQGPTEVNIGAGDNAFHPRPVPLWNFGDGLDTSIRLQ